MRGGQLIVEQLLSMRRLRIKKAVDAFEFTVDLLAPHDLFDFVDRAGGACGGQARAFLTVKLFHVDVSIVEGVCQVGRGAAGHAAADRDRKSTRLNSSHLVISYAVFCLKKTIYN